ncbi:class III lanthionine synthetase LanKC [Streptomyces sp. NPDC056534]|uniref:class III lanthionine synthetase LanKC n=1 Tax=Streptomyces sp. NPDC056534 TaxID=3345857 RepID=UPI00368170C3
MLVVYFQFCSPESPFYDKQASEDPQAFFEFHRSTLPPGWSREAPSEWVMYTGPVVRRWQGWKIHVSATVENAEHLLDVVSAYCLEREIPFKALSSMRKLILRNSKYADRGGSGKFITIYPPNDDVFRRALEDLDEKIGGQPGPGILSDLKYREGPLFVRYGAFLSRRKPTERGGYIECIEDPDGNLVPDERRPGFHPPNWAEIPECLESSIATRGSRTLSEFPYSVQKALHFSNSGGVYLAERKGVPGKTFLLKEARPYCGLDETKRDAIERLEIERSALLDLAGLQGVPEVDSYVDGVEHKFLARAYVEGKPLTVLAGERNPIANPGSPMSREEYATWAQSIMDQITETIAQIHQRGWVFGDLHSSNIIVDDDNKVHLIDFESASQDTSGYVQTMGAFGFRAPAEYRGTAVDQFGLGCIRISLLMPITRLLTLGPESAATLRKAAGERFDLPDGYFDSLDAELGWDTSPRSDPHPPHEWSVRGLSTGLSEWRTPEREDRLFPGDIRQFLQPAGGLALSYGAAGVLWALDRCGTEVDRQDSEWLRERVRQSDDISIGFWNGLAGVAFATAGFDPEFSDHCIRRAIENSAAASDISLGDGLAGLGIYLLRDPRYLDVADALAARVLSEERSGNKVCRIPGLVDGASGVAVFAMRAANALGNKKYEALAARLLKSEVTKFGVNSDASAASPALPASGTGIASGVLGLGFALHDHVNLSGEGEFLPELKRIQQIAENAFAANNGLLNGRAGQIQLLNKLSPGPSSRKAIDRIMSEMSWHAAQRDSLEAVLGDEGLKLSFDLGTGLAGMLVTQRGINEQECTLPLWEQVA